MTTTPLRILNFDGHPITLLSVDGRAAVILREIGAALGYSRSGKGLVDTAGRDWRDRFEPEQDVVVLKGAELAAVKVALVGTPAAMHPSTCRRVLLTESGLDVLFGLCLRPRAARLCAFLTEHAFPGLAPMAQPEEMPEMEPPESPESPEASERPRAPRSARGLLLSMMPGAQHSAPPSYRELRLARRLELDERRFEAESIRRSGQALHALGEIDDDMLALCEVRAAEVALGQRPTLSQRRSRSLRRRLSGLGGVLRRAGVLRSLRQA
jgi:hypothetical protein